MRFVNCDPLRSRVLLTQVPQVELLCLDCCKLHLDLLADRFKRELDVATSILTGEQLGVDDDAALLPAGLAEVLFGRTVAVHESRVDLVVAVLLQDVEHLLARCEVVHAGHLDTLAAPGHEAESDGNVGREGGHGG